MYEITVKEVNFQNVNMVACQEQNGKVRVSIRSICDGLGVAYNGQMERINRDDILPQGVRKMRIPTAGGEQEVNMLDIEYLPFFLTGIKSSMVRPEIAPKIVEFKLKAKDALAKAFIKVPNTQLDILRIAIDQIEIAQKEAQEAKQIATEAHKTAQNIKDAIIQTDKDWRKWVNNQLSKVSFVNKDYREKRAESYKILEERAKCRLHVRLSNLKERLLKAGATRTDVNNTNYLDVIEEDVRLKEIYTAIVKEMVIKYAA